ncbi:hypothetical protein GGI17_005725 [Coemansia sp. S146]|nr:hypothetical protein GGI17_005725 [Coemansia sp. S146]
MASCASELWRELERADARIDMLLKALDQQGAQLEEAEQKFQGPQKELKAHERDIKAAEEHMSELLKQVAVLGAAQAKAPNYISIY